MGSWMGGAEPYEPLTRVGWCHAADHTAKTVCYGGEAGTYQQGATVVLLWRHAQRAGALQSMQPAFCSLQSEATRCHK